MSRYFEYVVEAIGGFLFFFGIFVVPMALAGLVVGAVKIWRSRGI